VKDHANRFRCQAVPPVCQAAGKAIFMDMEKFRGLLDFPGASPRLRTLAADFAREARANWPDIAGAYPLPPSLLRRAGETGVTGIGIAAAHGGQGGGYEDICAGAAEISFWAQSPGLALFLFMHQLIARFSVGVCASSGQQEEYLPRLASGAMIAAQAVSEAETGASPRHMKTRAEKIGGGWVLSGEKTFVTNGPVAGLFITLAVTGERDGKREFSAFLVPASAAGLQVQDIGPLSFLRPASHGAVRFNAVKLADQSLLGEEGKALEFLARPFAALEDALMAGFLVGGLAALFMDLGRDIEQSGLNTPDRYKLAGRLQAGLTAFANLADYGARGGARGGAREKDRPEASGFLQKSHGFSRATRELALFNLSLCRELAQDVPLGHDTMSLFTDVQKSLSIRGKGADMREEKIGKEFLSEA
jgi:acyl-CoA dehydrogenase